MPPPPPPPLMGMDPIWARTRQKQGTSTIPHVGSITRTTTPPSEEGEEAKGVLGKGGSRSGFQGLPPSLPPGSRLRTPSLWLPCLVFVHALQNSSSCRVVESAAVERDLGIHSLTHNFDLGTPQKPPSFIRKVQYRLMMVNEKATEEPNLPREAICLYD